jgi:hypothetical protein
MKLRLLLCLFLAFPIMGQESPAPVTPPVAPPPAPVAETPAPVVPAPAAETPETPAVPAPAAETPATPPATPENPPAEPPATKEVVLVVGDMTYNGVKNPVAEADGVRFEHKDGVGKVKWGELTDGMLSEIGLKRPEDAKPSLKSVGVMFSEASFAGKAGMILIGLGLLCSLYGGLFMLIRAAGVSPFWALMFLMPGCVLAILFYAALFPLLKDLGFSSSGFMLMVTSISVLSFFCWLAFGALVGYVAWYSWKDGLPWPLYVLIGVFVPGLLFIFTRTDRGGKPFVWQLAGLGLVLGGGWLNLDLVNETLDGLKIRGEGPAPTAPAEPGAPVTAPAPAPAPAPAGNNP